MTRMFMTDANKQRRIKEVKALCARLNIAVIPYGNAHWIKGAYVDFVTPHLHCVTAADLAPRQLIER